MAEAQALYTEIKVFQQGNASEISFCRCGFIRVRWACVVLFIVLSEPFVHEESLPQLFDRVVFVLTTAFVFGYLLRNFRKHWKSRTFWATYLTCLTVHTVVFVYVLRQYVGIPKIYFGLVAPVELIGLAILISHLLKRDAGRTRSSI